MSSQVSVASTSPGQRPAAEPVAWSASFGWVWAALPWLAALILLTWALRSTGTPAMDIARYAAYLALGLALPGTLVARALLGAGRSMVADLTIGVLLGCALELAALALCSVLGLQSWLRWWPLLVVAAFVAVPGLRRHWLRGHGRGDHRPGDHRPGDHRPGDHRHGKGAQRLPLAWSWGIAAAFTFSAVTLLRSTLGHYALPPAQGRYYQDLMWHLGIVHELSRSMPPQIPQVSGEVLRYHWFSDAQMAAAHLVSGVPEATLLFRLWPVAMVALTALAAAVLAREVSGVWWSGPVAAWLVVVCQGINLLPVTVEHAVLYTGSPSQMYVLPLALGVATPIVRALRGHPLGRGWCAVALLMLAAAGAKPTALPMILAGAALAAVMLLVTRQRSWRAAAGVGALAVAIYPLSSTAVSGSDTGSSISFLDFMEWVPLYHQLTGEPSLRVVGPALPEGVVDLSGRSVVIIAMLLVALFVDNLARILPLFAVAAPALRRDPAAWFLFGVIGAGWVVYLSLSHPAYSQAYFLRLGSPFASVLAGWALTLAVPAYRLRRSGPLRGRRALVTGFFVLGAALGAGVVVTGQQLTPVVASTQQASLRAWVEAVAVPLGVAVLAVAAGSAIWHLLRRWGVAPRGWGTLLLLSAVLVGAPVAAVAKAQSQGMWGLLTAGPVSTSGGQQLPAGAGRALAWLEDHTPSDAVVATNRHCNPGPERPRCPALAFFVSGLGGRRTVLEGWAYTSASTAWTGPAPWPQRKAVNDAVFTAPDRGTLAALRRDYGATWLFADRAAGPVSGELARLTIPRFTSGAVTIYQLRTG